MYRDKVGILSSLIAANSSANSKRTLLKCNFDRGFQSSELNALRPQFCSDDRSRALPFCFSGQLPKPTAPRAGTSRESPARMPAGRDLRKRDPVRPRSSTAPHPTGTRRVREPGPGSNTITYLLHSGPASCYTADHSCGRVQGAGGDRECRTGSKRAGMLLPKENSCRWVAAEPWGQAPTQGIRRHLAPARPLHPGHSPHRAIGAGAHRGQVLGNARAPPRWSCSAPAGGENGPLLRHLPAVAAGRGGGPCRAPPAPAPASRPRSPPGRAGTLRWPPAQVRLRRP